MAISKTNLAIQGLHDSDNPFGEAPEGSLSRADDVVFTSQAIVEPRPGLILQSGTFGSGSSYADAVGFYNGYTLVNYDVSGTGVCDRLARRVTDSGQNFVELTNGLAGQTAAGRNFFPAGPNRMRMVGAARDLFVNTRYGGYMVSDQNPARPAGEPAGLMMFSTLQNSGSAWMYGNTAVAYRYTVVELDAYGREIEGPPSPRLVTLNRYRVPSASLQATGRGTGNQTCPVTGGINLDDWTDGALAPGVGSILTLKVAPRSVTGSFLTGSDFTVVGGTNGLTVVYLSGAEGPSGVSLISTEEATFYIARAPNLTLYLPSGSAAQLTTGSFVRVYRTEMVELPDGVPSEEYFKVYESAFLTTTDIANKYVTLADNCPESFLGPPLYTNPDTGEGATQTNFQPPLAQDLCQFGDRTIWANTSNVHSMNVSIVGVSSGSGLTAGDSVQLSSSAGLETYYASTSQGGQYFFLYTRSDPATNVERTARYLVKSVNLNPTGSYFAYYTSAADSFPGQMRFELRSALASSSVGINDFRMYSNRSGAFAPQLTPTGTLPLNSSDNNRHPARLYYSKLGQPEAVPPVNYVQAYSDNERILRVFPINYRLYVFKTDGIYYCPDTDLSQVTKISELRLTAPDSLAALGGRLYCLTDQGFAVIADGTATPFSQAVDDGLNDRFGDMLPTLASRSLGVGIENERLYACFVPSSGGLDNDSAFVYNVRSDGWTKYRYGARAAAVEPDGRTVRYALASGSLNVPVSSPPNQLVRERRTMTGWDYQDLQWRLGPTAGPSGAPYDSATDTTVLSYALASGTVLPGDVAWLNSFGGAVACPVLSASVPGSGDTTGSIRVLGSASWSAGGTYDLWRAVQSNVQMNPVTAGNPAGMKQWMQVSYLIRDDQTTVNKNANFATEIVPAPLSVDLARDSITGQPVAGNGGGSFGDAAFGSNSELRRVNPLPQDVSEAAQLRPGLRIGHAGRGWKLLGVSILSEPTGDGNMG